MSETLLTIVGLGFIVSTAIFILFCILYPVQKRIYMKKWRINESSDFMRNSVNAHFKYVKNIRNASLVFIILCIIIFFIMSFFLYPAEENIDNAEIPSISIVPSADNNAYKNNNKKSFQSIFDYYIKEMQDATPKLITEYKEESANNEDGINGLYAIAEQKMRKLLEIANEGIEEMGEFYLNNGSGKYSEYEEWFNKLQEAYIEETYKIEEVYYESAQ